MEIAGVPTALICGESCCATGIDSRYLARTRSPFCKSVGRGFEPRPPHVKGYFSNIPPSHRLFMPRGRTHFCCECVQLGSGGSHRLPVGRPGVDGDASGSGPGELADNHCCADPRNRRPSRHMPATVCIGADWTSKISTADSELDYACVVAAFSGDMYKSWLGECTVGVWKYP